MKKIILIDDDPAIREVFELILLRAGYAVTVLDSGESLLAASFEEPDIFIIDKQLTGTDGLDICRHLKAREKLGTTPVIIFSASPKAERLAQQAGANVFLEKPIRIKDLLEAVQKCLLRV